MKLKLCLILALALACLRPAHAQTTNLIAIPTNDVPTAWQPAFQALGYLPTTNLADANLQLTVGLWTGPSLANATVFQNYIGMTCQVGSNFFLGGELRNTFNEIDYLGFAGGYSVCFGLNTRFAPNAGVGWSFLDHAPMLALEPFHIQYQSSPGTPVLDVGAGYYELFALSGSVGSIPGLKPQSRGALGAHAGLVWAFPK